MTHAQNRSGIVPAILAGVAGIFGLATLVAASGVLFGPDAARARAGDIVPFVVWFNLFAGVAYLVAAAGLWLARRWAVPLAWAITAATAAVAVAFGWQVWQGVAFEPRTVGALALRTLVWLVISAIASVRARQ
ncbi:hypothetical protein [Sinisalibacter aestuarii]|uniref:Uncharacterized protein n=1 Tax=Sinisalibacter aestuarii TaxID=2949426 RepID=A0ABQ5LXK7_9RHOB|nr:hypothetical protein [Sinisalibacter aestuarii]GKY89121.1 hypothetical protein STA1M1_29900 [Sinisalibacter aestuarii]